MTVEDFHNPSLLPVIQTADVQRFIDSFNAWLHPDNRQPFIVIGPEGCGKGLVVLPYLLCEISVMDVFLDIMMIRMEQVQRFICCILFSKIYSVVQ